METRGGKILEFLKENSHLDLEVPDIAFNVKKSEKTVEAALQKLQQKGLVTARQNEYGRVYWYALPSAPETKSFKPEEVSSPKETAMNQAERPDDEVDLSDLKRTSATSPKKTRKTITVPPATAKEEAAAPVAPAAPDLDAPSVKPAATIKTIADVNQDAPAPEAVQPEPIDFEAAQPFSKTPSSEPGKHGAAEFSDTKANMLSPILAVAIIIAGLISLIALVRSGGSSEKIKSLETAAKSYATAEELKFVKDETAKITSLEANVAVLGARIDSLKGVVRQLADEASKQKKPPLKRRSSKKR